MPVKITSKLVFKGFVKKTVSNVSPTSFRPISDSIRHSTIISMNPFDNAHGNHTFANATEHHTLIKLPTPNVVIDDRLPAMIPQNDLYAILKFQQVHPELFSISNAFAKGTGNHARPLHTLDDVLNAQIDVFNFLFYHPSYGMEFRSLLV